ncbi:hypothetical protein BX616_006193, partial [Lobosporangium transversale]
MAREDTELIKALRQQMQQEIKKNREELQLLQNKQSEMLQMQKQVLDRLAIIQSRVQAPITQTYELHEYPIPRLFIVLPKLTGPLDKLGKPFAYQFRLFFLRKCGGHTKPSKSNIPHHIHLAKHEGYNIDRPAEFFEKYGSYVLTMLQILKYGVLAAGFVLPPLAQLDISDWIDVARGVVKVSGHGIVLLVDESINYFQNNHQEADGGINNIAGQAMIGKSEVLEGADLRRLQSFLLAHNQSRTLGNLYRIVTLEGHVKWRFKEIVAANGGEYDEQHGSIDTSLRSSVQAKEFYEVMVQARGIQELTFKFG